MFIDMWNTRTFFLFTLGCKTNQYDSQFIREQLSASGLREAARIQDSDICIVNGCSVTATAEARCRRFVRKFARQNPSRQILVTGCFAKSLSMSPGPMPRACLLYPDRFRMLEELAGKSPAAESISNFEGHTRAFLKVQDGCDSYCSYCIVPYLRGRPRSRPLRAIAEEARRLAAAGFKEIVLTGIHLGKYGIDLVPPRGLWEVIEKLEAVSGIERIRLSSIHAQEFHPELIRTIARSKKVCPHFHVPLESGDEEVLRLMNRNYTPAQYLETIQALKEITDNPSFTTDIVVGFPGETEKAFENTAALCKRINFSRTHVFPFSPRARTAAAKMKNPVPEDEKRRRKEAMLRLADEMALRYKRQFLSRAVEVLVLKRAEPGGNLMEGVTDRYMFTRFEGAECSAGRFVKVRITAATAGYLHGRQCGAEEPATLQGR